MKTVRKGPTICLKSHLVTVGREACVFFQKVSLIIDDGGGGDGELGHLILSLLNM